MAGPFLIKKKNHIVGISSLVWILQQETHKKSGHYEPLTSTVHRVTPLTVHLP